MAEVSYAFLALSLFPVLVFGILSSRSDMAHGLVRNRLVLAFSCLGLLLNLVHGIGEQGYFLVYFSNAAVTFILGFSLWHAGFWSAADAKMLSAYSLLLPLEVYQLGFSAFFPSQLILFNTFVPVFLVMFLRVFTNVSLADIRHVLSRVTVPRLFRDLALVFFGASWVFSLVFSVLGIPSGYFLSLFLVFILFGFFERFASIKATALFGAMCVLRLVFDFQSVFSFAFLLSFLWPLFLFWFFVYLVSYLGFYANSVPVKIGDLRPGMVPVQMPDAIPRGCKYVKRDLFHASFLSLFSGKRSFPLFSQAMPFKEMEALEHVPDEHKIYEFKSIHSGLSAMDVSLFRELERNGLLGFDSLRVSVSTPFAHALFAGVLLTYLAKGNFFFFLFRFISGWP